MSTDKAVRLTNAADKNEYYIVENRARQGWDAYIPTDGLLIYHATYSAAAWNGNYVNDSDMQRMTPVPADNYLKLNSINYDGEIYYVIDEKRCARRPLALRQCHRTHRYLCSRS